jgi:YfiH family protein
VRFTDRADGDMGHGGAYVHAVDPAVDARRRAVVDLPWTWLRQVHGGEVVAVGGPGDGAGSWADAAWTAAPGAAVAVLAADCAPVVLGADGLVAVAHAGWRGVVAGVLEAAVSALRAGGATRIDALLGPCIRPECYEFGESELEPVVARLGGDVASTTADGRPALDLPAAVRAALRGAGVEVLDEVGQCTSCAGDGRRYFSHRARGDTGRQAAVAWLPPA